MMEYKVNGESPVLMTSEEESWMVTYIDIGNVILSLPSGIMMDRLGRKFTLFLSIPLVLAGWTFILIAQQVIYVYFYFLLTYLYVIANEQFFNFFKS